MLTVQFFGSLRGDMDQTSEATLELETGDVKLRTSGSGDLCLFTELISDGLRICV